MSLQSVKSTKDERLKLAKVQTRAKQAHVQRQAYRLQVTGLAKAIVAALSRSRFQGVVYADSEELLYKILGLETGLIVEIHDVQMAIRHASRVDNHKGHRKHTQGDRHQLMCDAVALALETGLICRYADPVDNTVALYLPKSKPPKWTVFFADSKKGVANHIPTKRELAIALRVQDYNLAHEESARPLNGRQVSLLRAWGEHFA